jgi:hypothetical protein
MSELPDTAAARMNRGKAKGPCTRCGAPIRQWEFLVGRGRQAFHLYCPASTRAAGEAHPNE